jgi:hypothetical protein
MGLLGAVSKDGRPRLNVAGMGGSGGLGAAQLFRELDDL